MIPPKWSKECKDCQRRYPSMCGIGVCLVCKSELTKTQKDPTVDEEEFNLLSYAAGRTIPGSLPADELIRMEREWQDADLEIARRGPRWTLPDLLEEGFFGSVRSV